MVVAGSTIQHRVPEQAMAGRISAYATFRETKTTEQDRFQNR